ncbi:MAG: tetratricopeptide repeat protein, partial [Phormidesmis sp.]
YQQQALVIQREIGYQKGIADSLGNLGIAYRSLGDYRQAIDCYQQSLVIQREIGDRKGIADSLCNLGNAYNSLSDYRQAIDCYQQSLVIQREIGDRNGEAISLFNLGIAYAKIDEHWDARNSFEQAKELFSELTLAHMVEKCEKAIQERNQIISPTPTKAPPLPTKTTEPDWWKKSLPAASSAPSDSLLPNRPSKASGKISKWLPYLAIIAAVILLILLLQ